MRKLFIGCGIVAVVILGIVGYAAWRVFPAFKELTEQVVHVADRLDALDAAHPFDARVQQHLDGQRFARTLDLRVEILQSLQGARVKLDQLWETENDDDLGTLERFNRTLGTLGEVLPLYADQLQAAELGPAEFAWYTKLFWSTLYRIDAHAAGPELDPLKNSYTNFKEQYDHMARDQKWPPLADVLGEFPPAILAEASAVLERNVDRARQGLAVTELDFYFMNPLNTLPDVQALRQASDTHQPPSAPGPDASGDGQTPAKSVTVPIAPVPIAPVPIAPVPIAPVPAIPELQPADGPAPDAPPPDAPK